MNAKKLIALLLALAMVLSLTACGAAEAPAATEAAPTEEKAQPADTDLVNKYGSIGVGAEGDVEVNETDVHMDAAEASASGNWEALFTPVAPADAAHDFADFDLTPTAEELEAMKKEPAYGQPQVYFRSAGCSGGITVADELGYFEQVGIVTEGLNGIIDMEAVGAGQATVAIGHIASMLVPVTNGVDMQFVTGAHYGCKSMYVLADSEYNTIQDLKGTTISSPEGIGLADYNIACMLFDNNGMDPFKDVTIEHVTSDACVAAMQNGEISACILSDYYAYGMVKDGTLRCVASMFDEDFAETSMCCVVAMNGTFIKENPVHAKKIVQCIQKAHAWMRDNLEESTQLMADLKLNNGDMEMNQLINNALRWGPTDATTQSHLEKVIDRYLELGLITNMDDPQEILDLVWNPVAAE